MPGGREPLYFGEISPWAIILRKQKMKRSHSALRRFRQLDEKRSKMSQPGITQFTRRVTRRAAAAQQKQTLLDRDNSNIVSLNDKTTTPPVSPRKSESKGVHESSPAKIRKTANKPLEVKEKPKRGRKKAPSPAPTRTRKGETIQAAFQRQLEVLKSPTKVRFSKFNSSNIQFFNRV